MMTTNNSKVYFYDASSVRTIAESVPRPAWSNLRFGKWSCLATAEAAGMKMLIVARPGNAALPENVTCDRVIGSLDEYGLLMSTS